MQSISGSTKQELTKRKQQRPTQRLYVPPAQRNKRFEMESKTDFSDECDIKKEGCEKKKHVNISTRTSLESSSTIQEEPFTDDTKPDEIVGENKLVIMLDELMATRTKFDVDVEKEEMKRAIININRKSKPLIKHYTDEKSNVLFIDDCDPKQNTLQCSDDNKLKKIKTVNIDNWEDLLSVEEEPEEESVDIKEILRDSRPLLSDDDTLFDSSTKTSQITDLDHVIELYDFPESLRSQDIMQLYHEVHKDTYLKWCDDTHVLLVFSTPAVAQRALQIRHNIIKSRPMEQASQIAVEIANRCDLKPAMKRPQTTMQTARRMISTHLGTRCKITKEEQEKEKEIIRKAKALKLAQKQSEKDAWDGNPRPSTA